MCNLDDEPYCFGFHYRLGLFLIQKEDNFEKNIVIRHFVVAAILKIGLFTFTYVKQNVIQFFEFVAIFDLAFYFPIL